MLKNHNAITLMAAAAALVSVLVFWPGLVGGFFFDDFPNIVENAAVHITKLDLASLHASTSGAEAGPLGRPVSTISFALTHYFFGLNPFAFKATNLAIHAVNGLLVAWLIVLILHSLQRIDDTKKQTHAMLAVWTATVWVVHPINVIPVLLAVQRMTLLSGTFCLLALIAHIKATDSSTSASIKWGWLAAGWAFFWPLSVLSKETGLLFPLFVLIISIFQQKRVGQIDKRAKRTALISTGIAFCIGCSMLAYLGWNWLSSAYGMRSFTMGERLMTEARVLWFYAAQIVVPDYELFSLSHDDFTVSTGLLQPKTTSLAIVGWSLVGAAIVYLRPKFSIVCFGVAWFLVGHSLESTILPLELVHEYRNYIPSLGLILAVGWLGQGALARVKLDHTTVTTALLAATTIAVCAVITWTRSAQFGAPLIGTQIEAERHPNSARANHAAALALIKAGYGDKGDPIGAQSVRYYLLQSNKADPTFKLGLVAVIVWACASERAVEPTWLDDLTLRLGTTAFGPADGDLPMQILRPMVSMPRCLSRFDALKLFEAAVENPKVGDALKARFLEAAADYELLVSFSPLSSRIFLEKALVFAPYDNALSQKLKGYAAFDGARPQ